MSRGKNGNSRDPNSRRTSCTRACCPKTKTQRSLDTRGIGRRQHVVSRGVVPTTAAGPGFRSRHFALAPIPRGRTGWYAARGVRGTPTVSVTGIIPCAAPAEVMCATSVERASINPVRKVRRRVDFRSEMCAHHTTFASEILLLFRIYFSLNT